MRRLVITCAFLLALAAPASALALFAAPGDGTLVVRNADNGDGAGPTARPAVVLVLTGFVIGHVSGQGRVAIYDTDPTDQSPPEVTGAQRVGDVTMANGLTGTMWAGSNFRFRAVDGTFRVTIWGSDVYVFASGHGWARLTGNPDAPYSDGQYSLNSDSWRSLPLESKLQLAAPAGG